MIKHEHVLQTFSAMNNLPFTDKWHLQITAQPQTHEETLFDL